MSKLYAVENEAGNMATADNYEAALTAYSASIAAGSKVVVMMEKDMSERHPMWFPVHRFPPRTRSQRGTVAYGLTPVGIRAILGEHE